MAEANLILRLLSERYGHSIAMWLRRLDEDLNVNWRTSTCTTVVVRLEVWSGDSFLPLPSDPGSQRSAETLLKIKVLRHLGGAEWIVHLASHEDQNQLALAGHLDRSVNNHRIIAV